MTGSLPVSLSRSLLCVFLSVGIWVTEAPAAVIDRVVAVVNAEVITLSELEEAAAPVVTALSSLPQGDALRRERDRAMREVLTALVEKRLHLQEARKKGIRISSEELAMAIEDIKKRNGLPDDEALKKALGEENLSFEKYQDNLKEQLTITKLLSREVYTALIMTTEEAASYYRDHQEIFSSPEEVRISQIHISLPKEESAAEREGAREKALFIFKEIRKGKDFSEMARQYGEGLEREKGGDLGYFKRGDLLPRLDQAAFSLDIGEVSEPIETPLGFHILRVEEKRGVRPKPLDEVRPQIEEALTEQKAEELHQRWLTELKARAYIDIRY